LASRENVSKIIQDARELAAEGQVDRAIAQCRQTLTRHPEESQIYVCLGDLSLQHQLMPEASAAYYQAAQLFLHEGSVLNAVGCYKHIVKIEPHRADICVLLGDANASRGHLNNAVADYLVAAKLYTQSGAIPDAVGVYRKVLALTPHNTSVRLRVAELSLHQGQTGDAVEEYLQVAEEYTRQQRDVEGQALYELILKHAPRHPEATQRLSGSEAADILETLDNQNGMNEINEIRLESDENLLAAGHPANGSPQNETGSDALPDIETTILDEGKLLQPFIVEEGPPDGGETKVMVESDSVSFRTSELEEDFEAQYELALAYKEMGLLDEAIEAFEQALRGPSRFLDSCTMIAMCYKDRRLNKAAIEWLERAVRHPQCEGALALSVKLALAQLYEMDGNAEKAVQLYSCIPGMRPVAAPPTSAETPSRDVGAASEETAAPSKSEKPPKPRWRSFF
jgi:tetratricopeptide (TPR) repeat protein